MAMAMSYMFTYIYWLQIDIFQTSMGIQYIDNIQRPCFAQLCIQIISVKGGYYMNPHLLFSAVYWSWVGRETDYHGIDLVLKILESIPGPLPGALIFIQLRSSHLYVDGHTVRNTYAVSGSRASPATKAEACTSKISLLLSGSNAKYRQSTVRRIWVCNIANIGEILPRSTIGSCISYVEVWPMVAVRRHMTWYIGDNIGSGNVLLPDDPKSLPEPLFVHHQKFSAIFSREQFHRKCLWTQMLGAIVWVNLKGKKTV